MASFYSPMSLESSRGRRQQFTEPRLGAPPSVAWLSWTRGPMMEGC